MARERSKALYTTDTSLNMNGFESYILSRLKKKTTSELQVLIKNADTGFFPGLPFEDLLLLFTTITLDSHFKNESSGKYS